MAHTNYTFGPRSRDITIIEHYHEAPSLQPLMQRFIEFAKQRNQQVRTLLIRLEGATTPEDKQRLIAALQALQSGHEQDLGLFKNLLQQP